MPILDLIDPILQGSILVDFEKTSCRADTSILSSLAAQLGGHGLVAYAAANYMADAILNFISCNLKDTRCLSINWDNWGYSEDALDSISRVRV